MAEENDTSTGQIEVEIPENLSDAEAWDYSDYGLFPLLDVAMAAWEGSHGVHSMYSLETCPASLKVCDVYECCIFPCRLNCEVDFVRVKRPYPWRPLFQKMFGGLESSEKNEPQLAPT